VAQTITAVSPLLATLRIEVTATQTHLYPGGDRAALAQALRQLARLLIENPRAVDCAVGHAETSPD
jgi:hypothetical protein